MVFSHPPLDDCPGPQNGDLVKRVIALPGQTIYSSGNNIYVNGHLLSEPYLPRYDPLGPPIPDATRQHPYRVPAGDFYVLGDNRAISCDSRYWGPITGLEHRRQGDPGVVGEQPPGVPAGLSGVVIVCRWGGVFRP